MPACLTIIRRGKLMYNEFAKIIEHEMVPALGCTDPIGIAFTASSAVKAATGGEGKLSADDIVSVTGYYSNNLIKNVSAVKIPGTNGLCGASIATALGVIAGNSNKKLEALKGITEEQVAHAVSLDASGKIKIERAKTDKKLYMKVEVKILNKIASVTVEEQYTNVTSVEVNGEELPGASGGDVDDRAGYRYDLLSLDNIIDFADNADLSQMAHIKEAIAMNKKLASVALDDDCGLQVGKYFRDNMGDMKCNATYEACKWTTAGVDARMEGCELPAMSNTDSGNQGIASTMIVMGAGKALGKSEEEILRAVALSCLTAIYIKSRLGALSTVCGAVIASTGSSCGLAYLQGGGKPEIVAAMKNMSATLAGMICDGAKATCALKVAACANAACLAAGLALQGLSPDYNNGIVGSGEEDTIDYFIRTSNDGLEMMDAVILDIIMEKAN